MLALRRIIQHLTACATLLVLSAAMLMSARSSAQVSEEEHLKHHPTPTAPPPGQTASPSGSPGGMMQGMGEMMSGMHGASPKQLYPTLMSLPSLAPEQRQKVEEQANAEIRAGTA